MFKPAPTKLTIGSLDDPKLSIDDVSGSVLQTDGEKGSASAQKAAPASAR